MRTITSALRTAAQQNVIKPKMSVKLRRAVMDFGSTYASVYTSGPTGFCDGYYDRSYSGIASDSAQKGSNGNVCRVLNWACVGNSDDDMKITVSHPTGDMGDYDSADVEAYYGATSYHRLGLYGSASGFSLFYTHSNRIYLRSSGDGIVWTGATDVGATPTCTNLAIAPVSGTEFFLCYLVDSKKMYLQRWYTARGAWTSDSAYMVAMGNFGWDDTHYFDAEPSPADSNKRVIVYAGAPNVAHVRIWSNGVYSEPYNVLRSDQEYAYQNVRVASLSSEGNYLYAQVRRGLKSTDDIVYTPYWVIMRSSDGKNWASIGSTGTLDCRGKVFTANGKIIVVSPATVMQANATVKLGDYTEVDASDDVVSWNYSFGEEKTGLNQLIVHSPASTTLMAPGQEVVCYYGVDNYDAELVTVASLDLPARRLMDDTDSYALDARGPRKALDNQSLADGLFQSGFARFYDFYPAAGLELHTGTWEVWERESTGIYFLRCTGTHDSDDADVESIATVPHSLSGDFVLAHQWYCPGALCPNYSIFWYEDANNYWRFGNDGAGASKIEQVIAGVAVQMDSVDFTPTVGDGCGNMVIVRGGTIYGYHRLSDEWVLYCSHSISASFYVNRFFVGVMAIPDEDAYWNSAWLYFREAAHDWSRGRLVQAVAAQAGVEIAIDDTNLLTGISDLGSGFKMSSTQQREVDVEATVDLSGGRFGIIMQGTTSESQNNLAGYILAFSATNQLQLLHATPTGSLDILQSVPYTMPDQPMEVRVTSFRGLGNDSTWFNAWVEGQFAGAFYLGPDNPWRFTGHGPERGFLGIYEDGSSCTVATAKSFPEYYDSYIWQKGADANSVLRHILVGSMQRLIEETDGTMTLKETGDDLGTYRHMIVLSSSGGSDREWASVIRVTGAEVYVEYAHQPLLIARGERVVDIDIYHLWSEMECLEHAQKVAEYMETMVNGRQIAATLDPAVQPLDQLTIHADIEGTAYDGIVMNGTFTVRDGAAMMQLALRAAPVSRADMQWDVDNWDEGYWQ